MRKTQATSLDAYARLRYNEKALAATQKKVLKALQRRGPSTDREVATETKMEINSVTARRNELVKMGWVTEGDRATCTVTGNHAMQWVGHDHQLAIEVSDLKTCGHCGGRGQVPVS